MSPLFNCWFGFILWGLGYFCMRNADREAGTQRQPVLDYLSVTLNVVIMLTGLLYLTLGTYVSVQGIIDQYSAGTVGGVFSSAGNGT